MVHKNETRKTPHGDALSLAEIKEGEWYTFHYCFPMGRGADRANYQEMSVRALIVKVQKDSVTLRHGDAITHSFSLFQLGMEPDKDGRYVCHHRLARR